MFSGCMRAVSPSVPVNGSKRVKVLHHNAMKVPEAIQFPEIVQVDHSVLPQSGDLTERLDNAAALRVRLSDHRHAAAAAAAAHTRHFQRFNPGQRQRHWAAPHIPPDHPANKSPSLLYLQQLLRLCQGRMLRKQGGWSK